MFKKLNSDIQLIRKNWFYWIVGFYVLLGLYILFIVYSAPFVSIELEEKNGQWFVEDPYYKKWAENNQIAVGDRILQVDTRDINENNTIKYDHVIRAANSLTIQKQDGQIMEIEIHHLDIPEQFFTLFVFPACYFLLTLYLALYFNQLNKKTNSLNILIIFMLTVSLAYISSGASGRLNNIGSLVNGSCMLLCLVLLLEFLKRYFSFLNIEWVFIKNVKIFYLAPLISIVCSLIVFLYPTFLGLRNLIILSLFVLQLIFIFVILIHSYVKHRIPQIKFLFFGIVLPFSPFLLLYVVPEILFHKPILYAEIAALFLLLIPFTFISTQLTERLFNIEYYITRLRYYVSFSFVFSLWLSIGFYLFVDRMQDITTLLKLFIFFFLSLIAFLYIKEKTDYNKRKVLFSSKGDYIHHLYATIDKIGKAITTKDLLARFTQEIANQIELDCAYVVTYNYKIRQYVSNEETTNSLHENIDKMIIDKLKLGDIWRVGTIYVAFIHQDVHYKKILVLEPSNATRLKDEELLWLELLLLYLNNFIENTKMIEELIEDLKQIRQADENQLPWLNKLLWLRFEEEKYQLAQELHDTNLQEQLHNAREVDLLIHANDTTNIQLQLAKIHEQMVTSLHDLRAYCENLKPPLLDTLGLNAALEKLLQKISLRANFVLSYSIDRLYLKDEQLNLVIYRLFQELLNNALKHSYATSVEIDLNELSDGFEIIYSDNGVGCDLKDVMKSDSMGIKGMKERVKTFNGQLEIASTRHNGMTIRIIIREGRETLDYTTHS